MQERLCSLRVIRSAETPDPFALPASSAPLRHFLREPTSQRPSELALEILDALLPPPALLDDEGDALRSLRCAAREDARRPREERLRAGEVVEQARAGEEEVAEGRGRGGRRGWEEEELQRGEGRQVRAAARRAVDAVYDHHAVHAAGVVDWEPPAELAGGGRWRLAWVDGGLAGSQLVDLDVDASSLEDMAVDLVLCLAYLCGGERSREIDVCRGRPWGEGPRESWGFEGGVDDRRKKVLRGVQAHLRTT